LRLRGRFWVHFVSNNSQNGTEMAIHATSKNGHY
jgi:hypothetical protein